jgi:hypothetical protein
MVDQKEEARRYMTKLHPPISKIAVTPSVYIEGERTQDAVFGMEKYL